MIYLTYLLLISLVIVGCKVSERGQLYDDYLSLAQNKSIQGLFAVLIMVHHISQKLSEPGTVPDKYVKHGLDPFMYIGYLLVAYYFFSSGYGLYKSYKNKENYLTGFLSKHLPPVIIMLAVSSYFFMYVGLGHGMNSRYDSPMTLFGPWTNNPYSWYIYAIIICYVLFYNCFKRAHTERAAITAIIIGLAAYILFCNYWLYGDWWYNTVLVFPAGIYSTFSYYQN